MLINKVNSINIHVYCELADCKNLNELLRVHFNVLKTQNNFSHCNEDKIFKILIAKKKKKSIFSLFYVTSLHDFYN